MASLRIGYLLIPRGKVLFLGDSITVSYILITKKTLKTLPVGLAAFVGERSTDWGAMGACLVISSIPTIIMYLVFSEQVEKALTVSGAIKGSGE